MENKIATTTTGNAKEIVLAGVKAIQDEDFARARKLLHDDFSLQGVLGSRRGADAYIHEMEKLRFQYDIKKVFADDNDVCLLSDISMGDTSIFVCSWYKLDDGRIRSLRVVFDPRPVLENSPAPGR